MHKVTSQLGQLLLESGFITGEQVEEAEKRSEQTGLPIGRLLVLGGTIEEKFLHQVLEVMIHLRDDAMFSEADAVEVMGLLKADADGTIKEADIGQVKSFFSRKNRPMRIGELLVRARLVTETDVINAVEESLANHRKVGQVLVINAFITIDALDMGLSLLKGIISSENDPAEAAKTLSEAHQYPDSDSDAH